MNLIKHKVTIMRLLHIILIAVPMLFSLQAAAGTKVLIGTPLKKATATGEQEKKWYYPQEISELKIKQSNDGTGIIKDIRCGECGFQIVTITPDTKVIVNGEETDLLRARERAGQQAYIEFDKDTAEVKHIYWSE